MKACLTVHLLIILFHLRWLSLLKYGFDSMVFLLFTSYCNCLSLQALNCSLPVPHFARLSCIIFFLFCRLSYFISPFYRLLLLLLSFIFSLHILPPFNVYHQSLVSNCLLFGSLSNMLNYTRVEYSKQYKCEGRHTAHGLQHLLFQVDVVWKE